MDFAGLFVHVIYHLCGKRRSQNINPFKRIVKLGRPVLPRVLLGGQLTIQRFCIFDLKKGNLSA
jgi:hypothetical protein